ncbi:hypothetical protein [Hoeflea sp.]|uniref:hypothetical protein n=1 Tax=Hoeflea sp. TaxID=1940281 RepID=UPI003BAFE0CB
MQNEIVTIGLSEAGNKKLDEMKGENVFNEKMDGFRFAVALALAHGVTPPDIMKRSPFLNIGSLDPDQTLKHAVETLLPLELKGTTPYRLIERLAEWGVNELYNQHQEGGVNFTKIFEQIEEQVSAE